MDLRSVLIVSALLMGLSGAPQAQVYKCRMANGSLSFQVQPCPSGTHLKTLVVPATPEAPAGPAVVTPPKPAQPASQAAAPAVPADQPAASTSADAARTAPPVQALPVAAYYRCLRHDGSSYYSASPYARRQQVLVSELGDPGFAQGDGESGKVWVEDRCSEISLREACEWYEQQAAYVAAQQRVHSGTELKKLVAEYQRLSTIRSARCRTR